MKQTGLIFLIATLVISVCSMLFASAFLNNEPTLGLGEEKAYVYKFTPQTDPKRWVEEITSSEAMYRTVDIPEKELLKMSTRVLLGAILDYPFIINLMAFNSLQTGYDRLHSVFSGLREFENREDAASVLVDYYSKFDYAEKYGTSDILEHFWLEILLAQEKILKNVNVDELVRAISNNLDKQRNLNINAAAIGMEFLVDSLNDSIAKKSSSSNSSITYSLSPSELNIDINRILMGNTTTSTPSGTVVKGKQYYELEPFQVTALNNEFIGKYPSSSQVSSSSSKYNCHAYAWNGATSNQHIWIDVLSEVNKFRNDSKYVNLGTANANFTLGNIYNSATLASWPIGSVIYFNAADHSEIRKSTTMVESKWGFGPLMQHGELSPYDWGSLIFYKLR